MPYDFDKIIERKNTNCYKHDATQKYFGKDDILPMWVADMDFEAPDFIQNALRKRADHPVYGYTFFSKSFYVSLIKWMEKRHNYNINASWLTVTPGVVTGISVVIMALTDPGDKIIIQPPVYYPFFHLVENNQRKLVLNNLVPENGRYVMDFNKLEKSIDKKTKMIIISNPHNPVGRVWTKPELEKLVAVCEKYNILIIADEIHCDILFEPYQYIPISGINEYAKNNSVTFVAPSKTFNLAGLGTSVVVIPNEQLRKKFTNMTERLHFGGNVFGTVAFEAAYTHGEEWLNQLLDYLKGNIELVKSYFARNLPQIKVLEPEGTYLLWLDFSDFNLDDEQINKIMIEEAGVGLNRGISFGTNGKNYMRLNIGSPRSLIKEGVEKIIASFSKYVIK